MQYTLVEIDCERITDWETFHQVFAEAFGFPDFYGRNMNAWIDCMTSLDSRDDGMTSVHAPPGGCVVLQLNGAKSLADRQRDLYHAVIECSAFVNWRRMEHGDDPILLLSFFE